MPRIRTCSSRLGKGGVPRHPLWLARQVRRSFGVTATMIDIGGGFPVSYREEMPSIGAIGAVIDDVLGPDHGFRVLAEPAGS